MAKKLPLMTLKPTEAEIAEGVEQYFEDHGGPVEGTDLADHITDPTPHPAYDNLPNGVFVAFLQNGMA